MSVLEHFLLNKVNRRVTAHEITNELKWVKCLELAKLRMHTLLKALKNENVNH